MSLKKLLYNYYKIFHNGSNYDYHFIIKELADAFKKQFTCSGKNTKKYLTFTVPIENKVTRRRNYKKSILHITMYW